MQKSKNFLRRGLAEIQDPKNRKNSTSANTAQLCRAISSQLRHQQSEKNLLNSKQYLPHMSLQYGEFRQRLRSVGEFGALQLISTGFASWQRYCTALYYGASAKLCGVEQRAPPIFSRAAITLGIVPHSSCPVSSSFLLA